METLKRLLRRLRNKLFGIPKFKTGTGVWTAPKGTKVVHARVARAAGGSASSKKAVKVHYDAEVLGIYDVPTRRADEPVGGKNAEGKDLTPFIKQEETEYKFWKLTKPELCPACVMYKGPNFGSPCLHTCLYCGCYSTRYVECGGMFCCGNLLCTSSGGAWFRFKLESFMETYKGDSLSGRHTVDASEWKQAAMRFLEEHPDKGYTAVWKEEAGDE